jgi:hypothetical protein
MNKECLSLSKNLEKDRGEAFKKCRQQWLSGFFCAGMVYACKKRDGPCGLWPGARDGGQAGGITQYLGHKGCRKKYWADR